MMLSQGVPMILAGDEVLRSQRGNNNAWCQNNEIGWFDWNLVDKNADMLDFTRGMIVLRRRHPSLQRRQFFKGPVSGEGSLPDIHWHGDSLEKAPWDDPLGRLLRFTLAGTHFDEPPQHVILNMSEVEHRLELPPLDGATWRLAVDTHHEAAPHIHPPGRQPPVFDTYCVKARSVVVLEGYSA